MTHTCTLSGSISTHTLSFFFSLLIIDTIQMVIIVGRISTSHINSRGHPFSVKKSKEVASESFKRDQEGHYTTTSTCKTPQSLAVNWGTSIFIVVKMFVDERILTLFKRNAHHTLTYWSVFFSFGLCIAFLGPTILDLQCQTNSTLSQITWVFFSQQFCLLIGSSIGGVFKRT